MEPDTERAVSARADSCTSREAPREPRSVTDSLKTDPDQAAPNVKAIDSRQARTLIGTTGPTELADKTSKVLPSFVELLGNSENFQVHGTCDREQENKANPSDANQHCRGSRLSSSAQQWGAAHMPEFRYRQ